MREIFNFHLENFAVHLWRVSEINFFFWIDARRQDRALPSPLSKKYFLIYNFFFSFLRTRLIKTEFCNNTTQWITIHKMVTTIREGSCFFGLRVWEVQFYIELMKKQTWVKRVLFKIKTWLRIMKGLRRSKLIHEVRVYFISQTIISEWLKGYTCENSNFNKKYNFSVVVNNLRYIPDG